MKANVSRRRRWLVLLVLGAALAGLWAQPAFAPRNCGSCGPEVAEFGMVGIIEAQTLRLNAVNITPAPSGETAEPCRVRLAFAALDGGPLGREPQLVELAPGQGTFVDLPASGVVGPGERAQVRPLASIVEDSKDCGVMFTAEVFGPSGATEVYIQDRNV